VAQFLEPFLQFLDNRPKKPITQYSKNRPNLLTLSGAHTHLMPGTRTRRIKVDQSDKDRFKRPGTDVMILEIFSQKKLRKNWRF
jgi:hypothetical protein